MIKIGFIGSGKMASALASAILREKICTPEQMICSDILEGPLQQIKQRLGIEITLENIEVIRKSDVVFLAFKPQNFPEAILDVQEAIREDQIILSIMAGVRIKNLQQHLKGKIVRVMPNAACLTGQMAAGYAAAKNLTQSDLEQVEQLLNSAGVALQVNEEQLDAVTGTSGSGPAFVARLIDYYINAAVQSGLPHDVARKLTLQTFLGTATLLKEWDMPPQELIDMVSSPNGTTVAGREVLESSDIKAIIEATILRATQRSKELGQ